MNKLEKLVGRTLEDAENYKMRKSITNELFGDYQTLLKKRLFMV